MNKRTNAITMKGKGLTLLGDELKVGDKAPDFQVTANDLSPVNFSKYQGSVCILVAVPSLDTPVCDREAKRFNDEALNLGEDVRILIISADLPFAQTRWCGANGIDRIETLSDFKDNDFGTKYGVLMEEVMLLARAIFIVDKNGTVQYVQIVKEVTDEPDYDSVLKAARELVNT
jgi:thiol peroxidase